MQATTGLWANRNYRLVFSASAITNLGDGVALVALPWLASLITRDPVMIALVATAGRLPWLLFSLPAGVITDRANRQKLVMRADALRCILMLGVVAVAMAHVRSPALIWVLALLAFLLGAAEVIRDNVAQTLLPAIVAPAQLEKANGQMWSMEQVLNQFIGPPLAGLLIGASIALPFGLDAVTFALSVLLISQMILPAQALRPHLAFWPALREAWDWLKTHPEILRLARMLALVNAAYACCLTILVLYAQEVLGLSSTGYGLMLTLAALGGVLGGLAAPRIAARLGTERTILFSAFTALLGYLIMALTAHPLAAALALGLEGFGAVLWNVVTVSYRQRVIPAELLGRGNAIYRFFGTGAMALGTLAAGSIVAGLESPLGRDVALHAPYALAALIYAGLIGALIRKPLGFK
ncbi:MFS transporter [Neogemmobacter tilapiae]|uniref:MFS transporter n=1 Tax=Neogemmobacter tilapiae TaxID=875041 RepID=A0A918TNF0_9RHOB|nr:MFS transporter [Gemmobacter tilapiae]GHC56501.1 MFS transporter [Gemmobacter tilapiae]